MVPSLLLLLLLLLLSLCLLLANTQQLVFIDHKCNNDLGNFTSDPDGPTTTYAAHRNALLSTMYSDKQIDYGFYNFSYPPKDGVERVYAIGLCRGDVTPDVCRICLEKSAVLLTDRCRFQKEAIGWYEQCMISYSNRSIFNQLRFFPESVQCSPYNISTTVDAYNQVLDGLFDTLRNATVLSGDSRRKVAGENATVQKSTRDTIYALLQCTPDLSDQNCTECLNHGFSRIHDYCDGRNGGSFLGPSCNVRYQNFQFFGPLLGQKRQGAPPPAPPPQLLPTPTKGKSNTSRTAVAIVVPVVAVVVVVLLLFLLCIYLRVKKSRDEYIASPGEDEVDVDNDLKASELMQFDFETISVATDNFSDANTLGRGGFGIVYKGRLSNGQEVAIKRLSHNSGQGETEFKNEVLLTGKLQHRNLVRLLGFCLERKERLLIYEFVSNKSLDYIIFDPIKRATLDWEMRFKIIKGIGRGLLYLHEDSRLQIIHRDLKTSNILLDEELNPKISDFGIARLFDVNQTEGSTMNVVGTFGYMAPEYIKHGQFSVKSDVFSFGVMVLEIICGRKNKEIRDGDNVEDLLSFAWKNWVEGTTSNIIDPTLNYGSGNEIMRCIHIGLLCVQEDIDNRPTMNLVLLMFNSSSYPLGEPSEPPFLMRSKRLLSISLSEQYSEATKLSDSGNQSVQEATMSSESGSQSTQGTTNKSQISNVYPR